MNNLGRALLVLVLLTACTKDAAHNSSIGALSGSPNGFRQAEAGMTINLPQDLGPHPQYRLEWWYLTANLKSEDGEQFGVQWTLFRSGIRPGPYADKKPGWRRDEVWLAHAALSRPGEHHFADRAARGGTGQAGVIAQPFSAWIDHWRLESEDSGTWVLDVEGDGFRYRLQLQPQLPPVLNGESGFSAKSAGGGGSMYFSYPLRVIGGEVQIGSAIFKVSGQGWFDREWSSQFLKAGQQGWDWFALHLDSGDKLMLFQLRETQQAFRSGTWIPVTGEPVALGPEQIGLTSVGQPAGYPRRWQITLPAFDVNLEVSAPAGDYRNSGLYPYWESPVSVTGSHSGVGYMELTGYQAQ